MTPLTKINTIRCKIAEFEYKANGLKHLNNSGVSVRNLKRVKGGYKADIILFLDDNVSERTNGCFYPDNEEWNK